MGKKNSIRKLLRGIKFDLDLLYGNFNRIEQEQLNQKEFLQATLNMIRDQVSNVYRQAGDYNVNVLNRIGEVEAKIDVTHDKLVRVDGGLVRQSEILRDTLTSILNQADWIAEHTSMIEKGIGSNAASQNEKSAAMISQLIKLLASRDDDKQPGPATADKKTGIDNATHIGSAHPEPIKVNTPDIQADLYPTVITAEFYMLEQGGLAITAIMEAINDVLERSSYGATFTVFTDTHAKNIMGHIGGMKEQAMPSNDHN